MGLILSRLREALRYDKKTGQFFWKKDGCLAGGLNTQGYWTIGLDGQKYVAHDLAWFHAYGRWPGALEFINGKKTDTRVANLRERTANSRCLETKVCVGCSSVFNRTERLSNAQWDKRSFCSKQCAQDYKSRTLRREEVCIKCGGGGPFKVYTTSSGRRSRRLTCLVCFNKDRKPTRWLTRRRAASTKPEQFLFVRMKRNSKRRQKEFILSFEEFLEEIGGQMPKLCPVLGLELQVGAPIGSGHLATVDRIDSSRPYQRGNIAIISWRANALKRDGTADEHRKIADWMDSLRGTTSL